MSSKNDSIKNYLWKEIFEVCESLAFQAVSTWIQTDLGVVPVIMCINRDELLVCLFIESLGEFLSSMLFWDIVIKSMINKQMGQYNWKHIEQKDVVI